MSASSLFIDGGSSKIDTRFMSPFNAPLSAGGYPISDASFVSATEVRTEQIALPAGSLQTKIAIDNSIEVTGSIKATAIPAAVSSYANVLGYNPANGVIEYQPAGGGGGGGGDAYGVFNYSATAPHGVDSWYNNTPTNIAFSNTGIAANQSWLGALQASLQTLAEVYIQVVQGTNIQALKVVSVTPGVGFTFVEYLSATIPPMWVDGASTSFYYTVAGPQGNEGPTGPVGATGAEGPTGPQGVPGLGGINAVYGNFFSTSTQLLAITGTAITYNNTAASNGVSIAGSQVTVTESGPYSMTFSAQVVGGQNERVTCYFKRNGSTIADSASYLEIKNGEAQIMTINFIETLNAGDTVEVFGQSPSGLSEVQYIAPLGSNPASPAIIFTIHQLAYQGPQGPTGPVGPAGTVSQPLANKLLIEPAGTPPGGVVNLTWSTGDPANQYVPLASNSSVLTVPPIDPSTTGTGWRFSKTYNLITVATSGLTLNNRYTIVTPGTINWTSIGAAAATAGTQFTYNGNAITGTGGTATSNEKISWYALNALFGLPLPQPPSPPYIAPSIAVRKKNLRNAWFLIKMNSDVAQQGSFAIQIETYAYQIAGNLSNDYTGRWAYSLPLQQGVGFSAGATTNITTSLVTPRLRAGFYYLLYAGDISPAILPNAGLTFAQGGSGLFAPSQVSTENTLRDPYDTYTNYPHMGLTSSSYQANAIQPTYGGSNPYTDPADVEVSAIYLNTNSTSPPSGVGQQTMDFNVIAFGYSGVTDANNPIVFSYTTQWV